MGTLYLRVEAVNLGHFVYDTADLSTIRGGGLMLLDSIDWVARKMEEGRVRITPIIRGASAGLFVVEECRQTPSELRNALDEALRTEYRHATFVVDVLESDGTDFAADRARLVNANRLRQAQGPSLIYPAVGGAQVNVPVCELDKVRPGPISESSEVRKRYGRERKQNLYAGILRTDAQMPEGEIQRPTYATEFKEIAGNSANWGVLQDKIAVLYLDGNKFGSLLKGRPGSEQAYFSSELRENQARFLATLLRDHVWGSRGWMNGVQMRIETLLWGGDEVIWVVPAWKGWELLALFYEHLGLWPEFFEQKLTFSAGLVFCHSKSPIQSIRKLAHDLCDAAKKSAPKNNVFAYQVLESFDNVENPSATDHIFCGHQMREFETDMPEIRSSVPRRQLHVILRAISKGESFADAEKKALKVLEPKIADGLRGNKQQWKHAGELWDYVAPDGGCK